MSQFLHVGRYSIQTMHHTTRDGDGVPVEVDLNPLVSLRTYVDGVEIVNRLADPGLTVGEWEFTISSVESANPGLFYLLWTWHLDGVAQMFRQDFEVPSEIAVAYPALAPEGQLIVEDIWIKLADLFDSALGGPHLQEYAQSHFGRERIAQLMPVALNQITARVQAPLVYNTASPDGYPYAEWGGMLEQSLWIEVLKHLHRSYIEQPTPQGVPVARLDRTEYYRRWQEVIEMEVRTFNDMLDMFKLSMLGVGAMAVIVAGGAYGKAMPPWDPARGTRRMTYPTVRWW